MDLRERTADRTARRHPWEEARAAFLLDLLEDAGALRGQPRVLDVGSGDAWFARRLLARAPGAHVTCWDLHYSDDDIAALAAPDLTPTRSAPAGPFDVGLLLDVIEHVEDDTALVRTVVDRVSPGGRVLVSVPAWPALFSSHDVALRHHRRYTPAGCRTALAKGGVIVEESGGFFHALLVPRALGVVRERVAGRKPARHGVGDWRGGNALSAVLVGALRAEHAVTRLARRAGLELPGLSYWAMGRTA